MSETSSFGSCSRGKRKSSDPDLRGEETKHLVEDKSCDSDSLPVEIDSESEPQNHQYADTEGESQAEQLASEATDAVRTKLGEHLCTQYGLTKCVLSNLSASDLRKACQVCRCWRDWVSLELGSRATRAQLHWLFWRAERSGWNVAPPLAVHAAVCEHVRAQPAICIAFFSKSAPKEFRCCEGVLEICPGKEHQQDGQACTRTHPFESYLQQALGPRCKLLCYSASGVIGCSQDLKTTFEVQYVRNGPSAMSAILLPDLPSVKVVPFRLMKQDLSMLCRWGRNSTDVCELLGLPPDQPVQALLLFSGYRVQGYETAGLIAALQDRQELQIAVGGGVVEKANGLEGVVFLGTGVCAASTVLPQSATEKDQVVEHLLRLKQCALPGERTLGFLFACLGRGEVWYDGETCVESGIFTKVFPDTPVLGFFGRGEIGLNHLPDFRESTKNGSHQFWRGWADRCAREGPTHRSDRPRTNPRDLSADHSYSTSVVLLSFDTRQGR